MRRVVVVAAALLAPSLAFAQAPGEELPAPAPVAQPAPVVVVRPAPVLASRWSVGISMGALGVAPQASPDDKTNFAVGELQVRYRATRHLELQLAAGGGQQKLEDGTDGDLEISTFTASVRYRFNPHQRWNWYLSGGLGALAIAKTDATDQQRQDATRPVAEFGVGLERRFRHFALNAELSAFAVGESKAEMDASTSARTASEPPAMAAKDELSGGRFQIGASYYF